MSGAVIRIRRSPGIEPLVVLTEDSGFDDPDKLAEKLSEKWPPREKRTPRRGLLQVDRLGADLLWLHTEKPYIRVDFTFLVRLEGSPSFPPGWFDVEKIENLSYQRPEGGAQIFLRETLIPPIEPGTRAALEVGDGGEIREEAKEQHADLELIDANQDLGTLEDLL